MPQAIGFVLASLASNAAAVVGFSVAAQAGIAAAAASLGGLAFSIGLTLGVNALFGANASAVKPSDGQQTIRQAVPPRWRSWGRVRRGGPVWWRDVVVGDHQGTLYQGVLIDWGAIDAFEKWYVDDEPIELDVDGNVTTEKFDHIDFKIVTRLANTPSTTEYTEIEDAFDVSNCFGAETASFLAIIENFDNPAKQMKRFPNGAPNITAVIRAEWVYDPRDETQDPDDGYTWKWSENPVLCLLTYLTGVRGYAIPRDKFDLAEWGAAADICDEPVASIANGGTEPRYRVAGTFTTLDKPADIAERLCRCFDGCFWQRRDGKIGVSVGRFVAPTVTLTDRDIIAVDLTRGQDPLSKILGVSAQYMSPQHGYREQDAEIWPFGDEIANDDRLANIDLTWVPSHSQARRLMKRAFIRQTASWAGTIQTNLAGLQAIDERFITLQIAELGIDESFEIDSISIDFGQPGVTISVRSIDATIDEWTAELEEGVAPALIDGLVFIPADEGDAIGNLTAGGGLAGAYDGNNITVAASCAQLVGDPLAASAWIGKSFDDPVKFGKAVVYGSSDQGFGLGTNGSVTVNVRGKSGAAPTSATDGTIIGTHIFTDTDNELDGRELPSFDIETPYDHIFFEFIGTSEWMRWRIAEVQIWQQQST